MVSLDLLSEGGASRGSGEGVDAMALWGQGGGGGGGGGDVEEASDGGLDLAGSDSENDADAAAPEVDMMALWGQGR